MWELIRQNRRRSTVLLVIMALLMLSAGAAFGYYYGQSPRAASLGAAVAMAIFMLTALAAYFGGEHLIRNLTGAQLITEDVHPQLANVAQEMQIAAGHPHTPRLYILHDSAPNAFATGRNSESAAILVTTGLLSQLNRDELQGVVAHEMAHIVNRDVAFLTLAGMMLGTIALMSDVFVRSAFISHGRRSRYRSSSKNSSGGAALAVIALLIAVLGPLLARILYFSISRKREYLADACAVQYTRYPQGLASALAKISTTKGSLRSLNRVTGPMFIVNPALQVDGREAVAANSLASTHPPIQKRINILRDLAGLDAISLKSYQRAYVKATGARASLFSQQSLHNNETHSLRAASSEPSGSMSFHQEADLYRAAQGFHMLNCTCGIEIKIPPDYHGSSVSCPRCKRIHPVHQPPAQDSNDDRRNQGAIEPATIVSEAASSQNNNIRTFHRTGSGWDTIDCTCGQVIQISPALNTSTIRCRSCGVIYRIASQD